ncbi:MAG: hypothetical protein RL732_679, partial [Bacteroidota bacterium]
MELVKHSTGSCLIWERRYLPYLVLLCLVTQLSFSALYGQTLPTGFTSSVVSSGWVEPMGIAFTKSGTQMYVWEKAGKVYVSNYDSISKNYNKQSTPVLDISQEVGNWSDYGMMGLALDPDYDTNGYIYLLYVVDRHHLLYFGTPNYSSTADEYWNATIGRVTKYKIVKNGQGQFLADATTRKILLGERKSNGIPLLYNSHGLGSLVFADDKTLLISAGDAASYAMDDLGPNADSYYAQALTDSIIRPNENVGAFRAQMVNSYNGKILRIDKETGDGISSNPFYLSNAPRSAQSRVWAMGFRNPFRFVVRPQTGSTLPSAGDIGEIYVGDVGYGRFEELNIIRYPGMNCGWPIYEGITPTNSSYYSQSFNIYNKDEPNPLYGSNGCTRPYFTFAELLKQATADNNTTVYNPCDPTKPITGSVGNRYFHRVPAVDWAHGYDSARVRVFNGNSIGVAQIGTTISGVTGTPFRGSSVTGGCWYQGTLFPQAYQNTYLIGDYVGNWIKSIVVESPNQIRNVSDFATNMTGFINLVENPLDESLFAVDYGMNLLRRITYGGNMSPVVKITADKIYGPGPLTVQLNGSASYDPEGGQVTYSWNFGDGTTSTAANPSHTFSSGTTAPKKFVVKLSVKDPANNISTDSIIISLNNTPPVVNIINPVKNSTYNVGGDTTYSLKAQVSDSEQTSSQLFYEWQVFLRHNTHEHAEPIDTNKTTTATISRLGCNGDTYYWLFTLKVTDAAGLSTEDSSKIFPLCVTAPPGINLQPQPQTACEGGTVTFTSAVSDSPMPPVQWQVSTNNGGSWNNISGATSATYSFVTASADNGKLFRAVWTNSIGSSISNSAQLTVKTAPAAPTGSSLLSYCFLPTVADLSANGTSLKWYGAATGGTALASTTTLVNGSHYYASQTVNGCESVNRLDVTASINSAAYTTITLDGSSSTGTISSYQWTLVSGPNQPVINSPTSASTTVTNLVKGTYRFQLSLNSGASTSQVLVNVNPDTTVIVHAGFDRTVTLPLNSVTLDGSGSTGTISSYAWSLLSGPNTPSLVSPTSISTVVNGLVQGNYSFILAAKDNWNVTRRDTIAITVSAATTGGAPVINTVVTANAASNSVVNSLTGVPVGALLALSVAQADKGTTVFNATQAIQPAAGASGNDGLSIELGMKFRSSDDGYVTGVRFFKPTNNDLGTHTGELYSATGTRLAQVTFTGETASGWQQANFATPVLISKNTTYIIAYHCTAGNYHEYVNYFQTAAVSAPLTGLADGTDGSNGLYIYSNTPAFPTSTYSKTNYWVDVVFAKAHATVTSSPALTWTKRADATGKLSAGNAEIYTARFPAGGSISITTNWSNGPLSAAAYSISNYDTLLGGASSFIDLQSVPSLALNTTRTYSTIIGVSADRNAVSGTSRTYRDAATESYYHYISGGVTGYHYRKPTTATGTYTEGLTAPTGMAAGTALFEVIGPNGPPPPAVADAGYNRTLQIAIPPTGAALQSFCGPATLANLVASGNQIKWYAAASGGTALSTATSLVNGVHYYASQTVNGCESVQRLDVTAKVSPLPPTPSITEKKNCNGSAVLSTTAKGSLLWSTGAIIDSIYVTTAGTYTLTVTDTSGCKSSASYQVTTSYNGYNASVAQQANVLCYGAATGSVTISASGPNTPFAYSLDNATYQSGNLFSGLLAGNYVVYVKDTSSCVLPVSLTITQPAADLSIVSSQVNVFEFGTSTGSITLSASGGTSPYLFSLDSTTYQSGGTYTNLSAGSYTTYVKDNNSCVNQ